MFKYLFRKSPSNKSTKERIEEIEYDLKQLQIKVLNKEQDNNPNYTYENGYYYGVHRNLMGDLIYTRRSVGSLDEVENYYPFEIEKLIPLVKLYEKHHKNKKK